GGISVAIERNLYASQVQATLCSVERELAVEVRSFLRAIMVELRANCPQKLRLMERGEERNEA
ncbi:MAG: hypothetical protein AB7E95_11520, partial [Kiritimatiellales bacterium]